MKFEEQKIKGVYFIEAEPFSDERGVFRRNFCQREYEQHGLDSQVCQANVSENPTKHTFRGFHFQTPPHRETKTFSILSGSLYAIIVDLRKDSETFLQWQSFELNSRDRKNLYMPAGCANAFLTLEDNTLIHYYVSEFFAPDSYSGIRYNDQYFDFEWPFEPELISERDLSFDDFSPESL